MATITTLTDRINELVEQHGSIRNAAEAVGIHFVYLFRLQSGERTEPGDDVLKKLKLRRVVTYEVVEPRRRKKREVTEV